MSVQLPKIALKALRTVPDYNVDPLLLAGLRTRLAQATAKEQALAARLTAHQGTFAALSARADRLAAAATVAGEQARSAHQQFLLAVSSSYTSRSELSPAVDALLSPASRSPEDVMYSANIMSIYASEQGLSSASALALSKQADAVAAAKAAQARAASAQVRDIQAQDLAAKATEVSIQGQIRQRIVQVRQELAAKQAAQRVTAGTATISWRGYLDRLGSDAISAPSTAALRDPNHLPKGLYPVLDSAGHKQPGVASRHTRNGYVLVLPKPVIQAIGFVFAQLGKPYVYAATGPNSFDCSGLTYAAYRSAGIAIPRISWDQHSWTTPVQPGDEMPGDLVYFVGDDGTVAQPGHVAMVINPAKHLMIQSPQTGDVVKVSNYAQWGGLVGFGRVSTAAGQPIG